MDIEGFKKIFERSELELRVVACWSANKGSTTGGLQDSNFMSLE